MAFSYDISFYVSNLRSIAEALCVILPTEILSTPVAATDFTVLRLIFPEASVS